MIGEQMTGAQGQSIRYAGGYSGVSLAWLTWQRLLLGIALFGGAGLRLLRLDLQPLNTVEAAYAWSAWRLAEGLQPVWPGANPLFLSLQSALFWMTGGSDFWARLLGASAGIGAIYLVSQWGWMIGRVPALFLAIFWAVDPWQVALSRSGDGSSIALFLALLALSVLGRMVITGSTLTPDSTSVSTSGQAAVEVPTDGHGLANRSEDGSGDYGALPGMLTQADKRRVQAAAVILGLLLVSGPMAWTLLPVVAFFVLSEGRSRLVPAVLRAAVIPFLLAVLLGATGWLARLDGMGGISSSITVWLAQFGGMATQTGVAGVYQMPGTYSPAWLSVRLWVEQLWLIIPAIIGLILAWRQPSLQINRGWLRLMTFWVVWGLFLLLLPGRGLDTLAVAGVPLLVGAAWFFGRVLDRRPREMDGREALSVGVTLLILCAALWIWWTGLVSSRALDGTLLQALVILTGLLVLLLILYGYWTSAEQAVWMASGFLLVLLLFSQVRTAWLLNMGQQGMYPSGLLTTVTHPEVRRVVQDLETFSAHQTGDPHQMFVRIAPQMPQAGSRDGAPVAVGLPGETDPVLAWYLRDFRSVTWPNAVAPPEPGALAVRLVPAGLEESGTGGHSMGEQQLYAETTYRLRSYWTPESLRQPAATRAEGVTTQEQIQARWSSAWQPFIRWWMYREPPSPPAYQAVRFQVVLAQE